MHVRGDEEKVGALGVELAVRRVQQPPVQLGVERVQVTLVPPAVPPEVRRERSGDGLRRGRVPVEHVEAKGKHQDDGPEELGGALHAGSAPRARDHPLTIRQLACDARHWCCP